MYFMVVGKSSFKHEGKQQFHLNVNGKIFKKEFRTLSVFALLLYMYIIWCLSVILIFQDKFHKLQLFGKLFILTHSLL